MLFVIRFSPKKNNRKTGKNQRKCSKIDHVLRTQFCTGVGKTGVVIRQLAEFIRSPLKNRASNTSAKDRTFFRKTQKETFIICLFLEH